MTNLLDVENLKTAFSTNKHLTNVVRGVSFRVDKGEIVGIVGESGCGKSVTALSIMRLFHDTSGKVVDGTVRLNGQNLLNLTEREMRDVRGEEMAMIFQDPMASLNPVLKISKQLMQGIMLHLKYSKREARDYSIRMLESVGIPSPSNIMDQYPHQLSGGMLQRVMIAIAMSCKPELLIADEPTTALDVTIQAQILELMKQLRNENNTSILLITHDLSVVSEICDRVVVMYAGTVVEEATVEELFEAPRHPYTKGLIDSVPGIGERQSRLNPIPGQVPNPGQMPQGCKFAARCPHVMNICHEKEPVLKEESNTRKHRCWLFQEQEKGSERIGSK